MGCQFRMPCNQFHRLFIQLIMDIKNIIPKPEAIAREAIIVLAGVLIAAYVLSRFPKLQTFVSSNSVTVKDQNGNLLF
uniref:Uncharacterized protein n=1 Tax=Corticoviridae sp. TaxID=2832474 RepID=A0A8D9PE43_9VIRU|nr:MAG TPA: hypothetical protein [Corticoviridae sp.]